MTVHLDEHKLTYVSAPKCGSSTLKSHFFEIENGYRFRPFVASGRPRYIHAAAYPTPPFEKLDQARIGDHWRFAIVRDPVARLVSHWCNQVADAKVLERADFTEADRRAGLSAAPDFANFVRNLDRYRELSWNVRHHTRRLQFFLGDRPDFYHALYDISELPRAAGEIARRVPNVPALQSTNRTDSARRVPDIADSDRRLIRARYASDYDLYGDIFTASQAA